MKEATVLREVNKAGKSVTRDGNRNWVRINDNSSLFWFVSGNDASCLSVESNDNSWSSAIKSTNHLRDVLR